MEPVLHLSIPVADLHEARTFYEQALGCRVGRVHEGWLDVWFFGMQLTLHQRPDQVEPLSDGDVRHFGVTLGDRHSFSAVVDRINANGAPWLAAPVAHGAGELSGKVGGKLADPSGNVIEIKYYPDLEQLQSEQ